MADSNSFQNLVLYSLYDLQAKMNNLLDTPIEYLKGVGPQRGDLLRKELNIHRYGDLINLYPNRYALLQNQWIAEQ